MSPQIFQGSPIRKVVPQPHKHGYAFQGNWFTSAPELEQLVWEIQHHLRSNPELVKSPVEGKRGSLRGHCYVASEVFYHIANYYLPSAEFKLRPAYTRDLDGNTHWYLISPAREILDLTGQEQYNSSELLDMYTRGVRCGFLTARPSKRAQQILLLCPAGLGVLYLPVLSPQYHP